MKLILYVIFTVSFFTFVMSTVCGAYDITLPALIFSGLVAVLGYKAKGD